MNKLKIEIICMLILFGLTNSASYAAYILDNFTDMIDGIDYSIRYDYSKMEYEATVTGINKSMSTVNIPKTVIAEQGNSGAKVTAQVRYVSSQAFWYRLNFPYAQLESGIKEIVFEGLISLSQNSFMNLPNLKVVDFGPNTGVGSYVFNNCQSLEEIKADSSLTSIGAGAFNGSVSLKYLPNLDNLLSIGDQAFYNCHSLTVLPEMPSLKSIGKEAFYGCIALQELTPLPALESIGTGAFQQCMNLMAIRGEEWNVTEIGDYAFDRCISLSILPKFNNFVNIGEFSFSNCERLREIDAAPIFIGKNAFNSCFNLLKVKSSDSNLIPENCVIEEYAFSNLPYFSELNTIGGLTKVGASAFYNCGNLEKLNLTCVPNGNSIFSQCDNLTTISLGGTILSDSLFYGCKKLVIDIPADVTRIGNYAFANCESLDKVNLPENLLIIEEGAFFACPIKEITIPCNIQKIEKYSFGNCSQLRSVKSLNLIPPICEQETFENVDVRKCILKTPNKALDKYEKASVWEDFKDIYCLDNELINITLPIEFITYLGKTDTIRCSCEPSKVDQSTFKWYSDNEEVVSIINGVISPHKLGVALISVTTPNGLTASSNVKVVQPITSVKICLSDTEIEDQYIEIKVGSHVKINATIYPEDAYDEILSWSSSNPDIIDYEDGFLCAKSVGQARITVSSISGASAYCDINVTPILPDSISMFPTTWSGQAGQCFKLRATVYPENTTDKAIDWTSDNSSVVVVDNEGKITAIAVGTAKVTATCGDVNATCLVTVIPTPAANITLNLETVSLKAGEEIVLNAKIYPETTTDKAIVWTSDNSSVAVVDNDGKITALSVGTAKVSAACGDVNATCLVTVIPTPAANITLNLETVSLKAGEEIVLRANVYPETTTDKTINWTSDNSSVAVVNDDGKISAVAIGSANVTARCGDVKAVCLITVVPTKPESISLSQDNVRLKVGENITVTATILPEDATDKSVAWKSEDPSVAIVDENGRITAISIGETTITASCGDVKASCIVTVVPILAESISLSQDNVRLKVGENITVTATILPKDATAKSVAWNSDDTSVAIVDENGRITAISIGETTITASCGDVKASCLVTVVPILAESISLSKVDVQLTVEEKIQLTATIYPENTSNKELNWSSNDESIATVDPQGIVTAKGVGETYIIATATDGSGAGAICHVTVKAIFVESITLSPYSFECLPGDSFYLHAKVFPDNATDKTIKWASSDEIVAVVDSEGLVTALKPGNAIITAEAIDGSGIGAISGVCVKQIFVESISLIPNSWNGMEGEAFRIEAEVMPENAYNKTLLWSSSDENVAIVDQSGYVLILNEGHCIITAASTDGLERSAECVITSVAGVDSIFSENDNFDVYNINGILIKKDVNGEFLKNLTPNIYIIKKGTKMRKLIIR